MAASPARPVWNILRTIRKRKASTPMATVTRQSMWCQLNPWLRRSLSLPSLLVEHQSALFHLSHPFHRLIQYRRRLTLAQPIWRPFERSFNRLITIMTESCTKRQLVFGVNSMCCAIPAANLVFLEESIGGMGSQGTVVAAGAGGSHRRSSSGALLRGVP